LVYAIIQREATLKAFLDDFWLLGLIFHAMIPIVLFMRNNCGGKARLHGIDVGGAGLSLRTGFIRSSPAGRTPV
jgi:hypothetical protein